MPRISQRLSYASATTEDASTVFDFAKQLIDTYEDTLAIEYDKVIAWVRRKIFDNITDYTRVSADGEVVAFFKLTKDTIPAELDDLYVVPKYQGLGIGSAILERCIDECDGNIFFYVFDKNRRAIALYERMGFVMSDKVGLTRHIMIYDRH